MAHAVLGAWEARPGGAGTHLETRACRNCPECRADLSAWCSRSGDPSEFALIASAQSEPEQDLAAVACLSAIERAGLGSDDVLLVLLADGLPVWLVSAAQQLTGATVYAVDDLRDPQLRELLTSRPTGRADGVVVRHEAAAAVRAVRRGGVVCVGSAEPHLPSVTDVVQREVRLVGAGGVSDRLLSALSFAANADAIS